ncbi:cation diffusion facilitator family transporter [Thermocatellispora tengchongensis]|uniref:Cation diffusion facilitator family transporter n=1 Tax=Thermocatellispora tengchongensis TaxID=1073253 RepID=A0A840PBL0_9ACTN|nr:cation diffusion facilitator family transporter [Thermocatellispora tengchongensis]MBB5134810.1 cation diffusion facilitator family transporter [Thermocatellispora tengchongensis]
MSAGGGTKAIIAALVANLSIAAAKFVAFVITASSSMLAESIHSVADSGNQILLLVGGKRAERARTPQHPFGYGRERYFYAFVVAVVLFTVGALFSLYEGWHKWSDPHPVETPIVAFGVLIFAIIAETFSFRTAIREANHVRGKQSWVQFIRRSKSPELPVIVLEDLGALLGLIFALFGVTMAVVTGDGRWDAVGTMMIGVLLAAIAVVLAVETKSLLIGESAGPEMEAEIVKALTAGPEVPKVIHLRTLHLGPEELLVAAKIAIDHDDTASEVARGIDAAEQRVRTAVPMARVIYLEPDLYQDEKAKAPSAG